MNYLDSSDASEDYEDAHAKGDRLVWSGHFFELEELCHLFEPLSRPDIVDFLHNLRLLEMNSYRVAIEDYNGDPVDNEDVILNYFDKARLVISALEICLKAAVLDAQTNFPRLDSEECVAGSIRFRQFRQCTRRVTAQKHAKESEVVKKMSKVEYRMVDRMGWKMFIEDLKMENELRNNSVNIFDPAELSQVKVNPRKRKAPYDEIEANSTHKADLDARTQEHHHQTLLSKISDLDAKVGSYKSHMDTHEDSSLLKAAHGEIVSKEKVTKGLENVIDEQNKVIVRLERAATAQEQTIQQKDTEIRNLRTCLHNMMCQELSAAVKREH